MSSYRPLAAVVLAAGEGSRIRSGTPKVLHQLCGRPMVLHVVDALAELPLERVVIVVGHGAERVTKTLQDQLVTEVAVEFVEQRVQRGTGDAVSVALTSSAFDDLDVEDDILVLPGDHPLLSAETIAMLATEHRVQDAAATADERAVDEINTSIYCFRRNLLAPALRRLSPENAQGEYYLTDAIEVLRAAGHKVIAVKADDPAAAMGVNDRAQLAEAEAALRDRINRRWMLDGVTMVDPSRTYIDATVALEPDVRILPGTILEGRTSIAAGAVIGPDSHLVDTVVGERTTIANTVAREVEIGDDCQIGPFAYLRPGTRLANGAKAGTFVELKNADIGAGTKVPHLSYVGDAEIGANANLGASTITANYDGVNKHRTRLGDGVHTSIHTSLVAPIELGDGAETGAGAVVTHDVPPGRLVKGVPARDSRAAGPQSREDADE
jgi:bifunctional UDP-N-acetylglucosamine pyrophosphorylase/glucosamine-1-phosphate N-acetyltransferase